MNTKHAVETRTMNSGAADKFIRAFLTCVAGHDMGSVPADLLCDEDLTRPCFKCGRVS